MAQTDAEYSGLMKKVAGTKGKMAKAVKGKMNDEAASEAMSLAGLYKELASFWSTRKNSDAESIAKEGETAASGLAAAAKAGNEAKMESELQTINGTCGNCHMKYREGSPGSFKIK